MPYWIDDLPTFSVTPQVDFAFCWLFAVSYLAWCSPTTFLLCCLHLVSYLKNHCQDQHQELLVIFSSKQFYSFGSYVKGFNPFQVDFYGLCKRGIRIYSFTSEYCFLNTVYWKKKYPFPISILGSVVKKELCWFISGLLICTVGLSVFFMPLPYGFIIAL